MTAPPEMKEFLEGTKLYGDDFNQEQITRWWKEEEEGYSTLISDTHRSYAYDYHALNRFLFYDRVRLPGNCKTLGLGSALGHELLPIIDILGSVTIIDPSDRFAHEHVLQGTGVTYRKPEIDGSLDFPSESFDLITCFGVLHHIANVSAVIAECHRVLKPGGVMFCREPIVSQGDWRRPRPGLTKNERGIPAKIFRKIVQNAGFAIERETLFDFAPFIRLMYNLGRPAYHSGLATRIDHLLSRLTAFNTRYHRTRTIEKFGPTGLALVLRKAAQ